MATRPRWKYSPFFKAKSGLAALRDDKTMSALATQFDVHLNQINQWKDQLPGGVTDVCDKKPNAFKEPKIDVKSMPGTTSSRGTMLVARGAEQSS